MALFNQQVEDLIKSTKNKKRVKLKLRKLNIKASRDYVEINNKYIN